MNFQVGLSAGKDFRRKANLSEALLIKSADNGRLVARILAASREVPPGRRDLQKPAAR
jgi:hypothetical protein